jgi:archaellum component FlaC
MVLHQYERDLIDHKIGALPSNQWVRIKAGTLRILLKGVDSSVEELEDRVKELEEELEDANSELLELKEEFEEANSELEEEVPAPDCVIDI